MALQRPWAGGAAGHTNMRRIPSWAYLVLPLALALLYAVAYPLVAPRPTLESVVPRAAVLTARYRGLAQLDLLWCFGRDGQVRPSEDLAERHNLPGLPGVDRSGHIHWVLLPLSGRTDPTLLILPVSDAEALEQRFELRDGPQDPARLLRRHAKHLQRRGDFAALAWDLEAARQLGSGGLTLEDRGEEFGLAVDVKGAIELALAQVGSEPWRSIVEALGGEPARVTGGVDQHTGRRGLVFPFGRAPQVAEAWRTARLWAYAQRQEIEIELEPAQPTLRALLARAAAGPAGEARVGLRTGQQAWLFVPSSAAFEATAGILAAAGVALPELTAPAGEAHIEVRALSNLNETRAWTLEISAGSAHEASLAALLGSLPAAGESLPLAAGAAPLTLATTRAGAAAPAGQVARSADGARLYVGADAERLARAAVLATAGEPAAWRHDARQGALLARGELSAERALSLLGPALKTGGLFSALGPGALRVVVTTDGRLVRVRLTRLP